MLITRNQPTTGGPRRTRREEIVSLFTGQLSVEPEQYKDISQSQGFAWLRTPDMCTFKVQLVAVKAFGEPFAVLDSQRGHESEGGGIATYPFNNQYVPLSNERDDEGKLIIDLNPGNFEERIAKFMAMYPQFFRDGIPVAGGTEINVGDRRRR